MEFDIQRQLMLKLKVLGMNAAVGYTSKLQFSGTMIIATATCTAVYVGTFMILCSCVDNVE